MDWRSVVSQEERSKYVGAMMALLRELALLSPAPPAGFDMIKLKASAEEFENGCFRQANSKDEYINYLRTKIVSTRNAINQAKLRQNQQQGQRLQQGMSMNMNGNMNQNANIQMSMNQQQQTQQQQQQQQMNARTANPNMFLAQQAQARQQAAQQLRSNQQASQATQSNQSATRTVNGMAVPRNGQQPNQNVVSASMNPTQQNLTPAQQQQLQQVQQSKAQMENLLKSIPIDPLILQRIPGLPPGVNTWQQISSLLQAKQLPIDDMSIIKNAYNAHMQMVQKQQLQLRQMRQNQMMQNGQMNLNGNNTAVTNDLNTQLNRHQQDLRSRQLQQNQGQPQVKVAQTNPPNHGTQKVPVAQLNINSMLANMSQEEQFELRQQAFKLLTKMQQDSQAPMLLTEQQRDMFVKRFIIRNQQQKLEAMKKAQEGGLMNVQAGQQNMNPAQLSQLKNNQQQSWNAAGMTNPSNVQQTQIEAARRQALIQQQQQQQQHQRQQILQKAQQTEAQAKAQKVTDQEMQQRILKQKQLQRQQQIQQMQGQQQKSGEDNLLGVTPTDQDRADLKLIYQEVAHVPVSLTNMTNQLTDEQKKIVMHKAQTQFIPLYAVIEHMVPTFYTLTKSAEATKKLLHMRFMVKEVLDGLKKNEYYATPDLLDKVRQQSQKYVDYIKDQLRRRTAEAQQQQLLRQQQQQQGLSQQQAAAQQQSMAMRQQQNQMENQQWNNNAGNSADGLSGITPQITPQQLLARKQAQMGAQLTPQQIMLQQQQQQQQKNQQLNYQPGAALTNTQNELNSGMNDNFNNIDMSMLNSRINTPELANANRFNVSPALPNASFAQNANFNNSPQMGNMALYNQGTQIAPAPQAMAGTFTNNIAPNQNIQPATAKGRNSKAGSQAPTPASTTSTAAPKKAPQRRKSKTAAPKKTSNASTPNVPPKSIPTPAATTGTEPVNALQAQMVKKEHDLLTRDEINGKQFEELRAKRGELFFTNPVDLFSASLANMLELNDEEAKIVNAKPKFGVESKNSPFPKTTLTPSAVLQTPLTFAGAKTPGSTSKPLGNGTMPGSAMYLSSPKLSPNSKAEIVKWGPKVTKEAITNAFKSVPEIRKLLLDDDVDVKVKDATIPTPPPDASEQKKRGSEEDLTKDVKTFKQVKLTDDNRFLDENDEELPADKMWDYDYVSEHLVADDEPGF